MNTIFLGHLHRLLGEQIRIEDVDWQDGYVHFSIPVDQEFDLIPGFHVTVCALTEGKLGCLLSEDDLREQLRFRDALSLFTEEQKRIRRSHHG